MRIRFWLALWLGKTVSIIMKLFGRKGTTLPGAVAYKICPDIIKYLGEAVSGNTVIITGTNGKTTTNNLLACILKTAGKRVAFNREGANMLAGITGVFLNNTGFSGKNKAAVLLLEVDEATVPKLCEQVTPKIAVVTNFFRDQLDRYGELDTTVKLVKEALPPETELILNADDPLVARIGAGRTNVYYFGADRLPGSKEKSSEAREGKFCGYCGQELSYTLFHYGQLGIYHCSGCDFKRPDPYIEAREVFLHDQGLKFTVDREYHVPLLGSYNLYNALAAFCAADRLGISREDISKGLQAYVSDAGRMEKFDLPGGNLVLTLVKNPAGFNQVIRTIAEINKPLHLLIAINDLAADGRDISWLWDVDFEALADRKEDISQLICSGLRTEEIALRLKYAGFPEEFLVLEHSLEKAVEILDNTRVPGEPAFILPTYTALFPLRDTLIKKRVDKSKYREASA